MKRRVQKKRYVRAIRAIYLAIRRSMGDADLLSRIVRAHGRADFDWLRVGNRGARGSKATTWPFEPIWGDWD